MEPGARGGSGEGFQDWPVVRWGWRRGVEDMGFQRGVESKRERISTARPGSLQNLEGF